MTFAPRYDGWSATLYQDTLYVHYSSALYLGMNEHFMSRYKKQFRIVKTVSYIVDEMDLTEETFVAALLRGEV